MIILKSKIPAALVTGKPAKAAKIKAEKAKTERTPKVKAKAAPKAATKAIAKAKPAAADITALRNKLIASRGKRERALERLITLVAKKKEIIKGIDQKIRKLK